MFFIVPQPVQTDNSKSGSVSYHVSVNDLTSFLAFEFLLIILSPDTILIKLEIIAFGIGAEGDGCWSRQLVFYLHPVVFFQPHLDEDDAPVFVEMEGLLGQFPSDEQFDGDERTAFGIE